MRNSTQPDSSTGWVFVLEAGEAYTARRRSVLARSVPSSVSARQKLAWRQYWPLVIANPLFRIICATSSIPLCPPGTSAGFSSSTGRPPQWHRCRTCA